MKKSLACPSVLIGNDGACPFMPFFDVEGSRFILPSHCTLGTRMQYPILLALIFGSFPELVR